MAQVRSKDLMFLKLLAEYRVVTVQQIAAMYNISRRAARKKTNTLFSDKLITVTPRNFGQGKGTAGKPYHYKQCRNDSFV